MGAGSSSYTGPIAQSLGSHVSSLIGSAATHHASQVEREARDASIASQQGALGKIEGYEQPFVTTGQEANTKLAEMLGLGGNTGSSDYGALNKQFNPSDLQNEPGYQFQLQEGLRALQARQSAQGNLGAAGSAPTAALRNATAYSQGLAGTTYQNAFDRFMQQQNALYNRLANTSNAGQGAASTLSGLTYNTGQGVAGAQSNYGNDLANLILLRGGIQSRNAQNQGNYLASALGGGGMGGGMGGGSTQTPYSYGQSTSGWMEPSQAQAQADPNGSIWGGNSMGGLYGGK